MATMAAEAMKVTDVADIAATKEETMAEKIITKENFRTEVLESPVPVILDFWATWCGPCRMIAPVLEQIAREQEGRLAIGKVNVDEQMDLATQFGITAIPTLVAFRDGHQIGQSMGLQSKEEILSLVK